MSQHTRWYGAGALVVLGIALLAINAVADRALSGWRLDLTSNGLYTLADGTREVLNEIEEPVNLYFFYSQEVARALPQINSHARRVQELLDEFSAVAGSRLRIQEIDPEPFTDEEDRAVELGIEPVPLNDGNSLYFGLAGTSAVGDTQVIRFFQLDRATLLEYDLSKLVYQLANPKKPVVGLLTKLPVRGGMHPQSRQPLPPWFIHERVSELFEIRHIDEKDSSIADDVDIIMLIHPAELSESVTYAIDQFVLRGGKLLAFVDPFAETAGPGQRSSSLDKLFDAWGIEFDASQVVGDPQQAIAIQVERNQAPVYHLGLIGAQGASINQDDVISRGLGTINMGHAGAFTLQEGSDLELTPLIQTSVRAAPIAASRMENLRDPSVLHADFQPGGTALALAARINGKFKPAFADGPPEGVENENHLSEAGEATNLVLIGDTDLLTDRFWVQFQNLLGQRLPVPFANNADLVINALDNLFGSNALINIRSRADYARPFDRVIELRREADAKFRVKEQELQKKLDDTEAKLQELQAQREGDNNRLILTDEQRAALLSYQDEKLRTRKQLRDVRHQLDKDIESLGTTLRFTNIVLVPLLLSVGVLLLAVVRRNARAAT